MIEKLLSKALVVPILAGLCVSGIAASNFHQHRLTILNSLLWALLVTSLLYPPTE